MELKQLYVVPLARPISPEAKLVPRNPHATDETILLMTPSRCSVMEYVLHGAERRRYCSFGTAKQLFNKKKASCADSFISR